MSLQSLCNFSSMSREYSSFFPHSLPLPFRSMFFYPHLTDALTIWLFWGMMRYFSQAAKPFFLLPVNVAESHLPPRPLSPSVSVHPSLIPLTLSFSYPLVWTTSSAHPSLVLCWLSLSPIHSVSFCLSLPLFCSCLVVLWGPNISIGLHIRLRIPSITSSASLHYLNHSNSLAVVQLSYLSLKQVPFSFFFKMRLLDLGSYEPFTSCLPLLSIFLSVSSALPSLSPRIPIDERYQNRFWHLREVLHCDRFKMYNVTQYWVTLYWPFLRASCRVMRCLTQLEDQ